MNENEFDNIKLKQLNDKIEYMSGVMLGMQDNISQLTRIVDKLIDTVIEQGSPEYIVKINKESKADEISQKIKMFTREIKGQYKK